MKTLKQLKEEYDSKTLPQSIPEELVFEDLSGSKRKELGDYSKKSNKFGKSLSDVPSPIVMPNLLMFRRITYRRYPDNQTVALYYSKSVDKYLSIPFGPTGNLNLSEAAIYDTLEDLNLAEGAKWEALKGGAKGAIQGGIKGAFKGAAVAADPGFAIGGIVGATKGAFRGAKKAYQKAKDSGIDEDWQSVNRKDKTDGLSQAAVNAYRRENPGSKLKTAVTEKNPTGKRAARRKSFCSRMGGMKKRLTSAKTARDPDSRINKALRRWNCEEDYKMKLYEMRMQKNEGVADVLDAGAEAVVPYYSAGKKLYKGDYSGAAKDAAVDTALLATGAVAGKVLGAGAKLASKGVSKIASKFGKNVAKAPKPRKAPPTKTPPSKAPNSKRSIDIDLPSSSSGGSSTPSDAITKISTGDLRKAQTKSYSPSFHGGESPIDASRKNTVFRKEYDTSRTKNISENKISDIRKMVEENYNTLELSINGRIITLNTNMAKRILEVYDSVNVKNKKIVEGMLNENLESFKKLLNFSIRN